MTISTTMTAFLYSLVGGYCPRSKMWTRSFSAVTIMCERQREDNTTTKGGPQTFHPLNNAKLKPKTGSNGVPLTYHSGLECIFLPLVLCLTKPEFYSTICNLSYVFFFFLTTVQSAISNSCIHTTRLWCLCQCCLWTSRTTCALCGWWIN